MRRHYVISSVFLALILSLSACQRSPQAPEVEVTQLAFEPRSLELIVGQKATFRLQVQPKGTQVSLSVDYPDVVQLSGDTITALKVGTAKVTATVGQKSASLVVTVSAVGDNFHMPYLRFFDDASMVRAYEEKAGHRLVVEDKEFDMLSFEILGSPFTHVSYIVGKAIQMYGAPEVLQSEAFKTFMSKHGFITDGVVSDGIMAYTSPYQTVSCFAMVERRDLGDAGVMEPGICFVMKPPTLDSIPYPMLDWTATSDEVKAFEKKRGYELLRENNKNPNRVEYIYFKKSETQEFTELFAPRYLFEDGKLIKVALMIAPAHYVCIPAKGGFALYEQFLELIIREGYTASIVREEDRTIHIYKNEKRKVKFLIELWNINLNGCNTVAAGLAFVPLDGPDWVE